MRGQIHQVQAGIGKLYKHSTIGLGSGDCFQERYCEGHYGRIPIELARLHEQWLKELVEPASTALSEKKALQSSEAQRLEDV
jgi:hypothetical protein